MKFDRIVELSGTVQFLQNNVLVGVGINRKTPPFFSLEGESWKPRRSLPLVPRVERGQILPKEMAETELYNAKMQIA